MSTALATPAGPPDCFAPSIPPPPAPAKFGYGKHFDRLSEAERRYRGIPICVAAPEVLPMFNTIGSAQSLQGAGALGQGTLFLCVVAGKIDVIIALGPAVTASGRRHQHLLGEDVQARSL